MFHEILINPATIVEFLFFNFIVRVLRKYVTNNQVQQSFLHILMGRVMELWGGENLSTCHISMKWKMSTIGR